MALKLLKVIDEESESMLLTGPVTGRDNKPRSSFVSYSCKKKQVPFSKKAIKRKENEVNFPHSKIFRSKTEQYLNNCIVSDYDNCDNIKTIQTVLNEYKEKKLQSIHKSLKPSGFTELFNEENIDKYEIKNHDDLLLLFLPNVCMATPLHFLLARNLYGIIKKIVNSIEEKNIFNKFLEDENQTNKITEMFEYILEEDVSYPLEYISDSYCTLPIVFHYSDYDEDELEANRFKIRHYLIQIIVKILKNEKFSKRNDLNTY